MRCSALLAAFVAERPLGNILTDEQIERHLKNAIRLYCGFATLTNAPSPFEQAQAAAVAAGLDAPFSRRLARMCIRRSIPAMDSKASKTST